MSRSLEHSNHWKPSWVMPMSAKVTAEPASQQVPKQRVASASDLPGAGCINEYRLLIYWINNEYYWYLLMIIVGSGLKDSSMCTSVCHPQISPWSLCHPLPTSWKKGRRGVPLAHDWHGPLNIHLQLRSSHMTSARLGRNWRSSESEMLCASLCHA